MQARLDARSSGHEGTHNSVGRSSLLVLNPPLAGWSSQRTPWHRHREPLFAGRHQYSPGAAML